MDPKLLKMRCKYSKQHHAMLHELHSASLQPCTAQNVRLKIPHKVPYPETPSPITFKRYTRVSREVTKAVASTAKQKIAQNGLRKLGKAIKTQQTHNRQGFPNFTPIPMHFRRKTADHPRSNPSSIQTLILRFGYLWFEEKQV